MTSFVEAGLKFTLNPAGEPSMHFVSGISKYCQVIASGAIGSTAVQSGRQPSNRLSLPSSHCSPGSGAALPQLAGTSSSPPPLPSGVDEHAAVAASTMQNTLRIMTSGAYTAAAVRGRLDPLAPVIDSRFRSVWMVFSPTARASAGS